MAKQKSGQSVKKMSAEERLGLRVSAMINSPTAQLARKVTIHRLDDDPEEAWEGLLELLAETDRIDIAFNDDGTVTLTWAKPTEDDQLFDQGDVEVVEEDVSPF